MSVCVWKQRNNIFLVWRTEISTAETPSCRQEPMRRKRQKKGNANIIHSIFKRQTHAEVHKIAQITLVVDEFSIFKYKLFFSCGTQTLRAECMLFDVLAVKCGGIRFVVVVVASCATKFGRFVVFFLLLNAEVFIVMEIGECHQDDIKLMIAPATDVGGI